MKSSLTIILGFALPILLMMALWHFLASAPPPAPPKLPRPAPQATALRSKADPASLKRFALASRPQAVSSDRPLPSWSEAADLCVGQIEQAARNNPDVQRKAAALLLREQKFSAAAEAFDRLLMHDANDPVLLTGKAMALSGMDRYDDAVPLFESATRLDPGNPSTHYNYAVALMRSNERDAAADAFLRVVRLQPDHVRAWFNLAVLYQASGKLAESLEIWRKLTDGDPTSQPADAPRPLHKPLAAQLSPRMLSDAWSHRGEVALDSRNAVEAEMAFLNVVRLEPRNAAGWCNVGIARAEQVRRNDALTALHIASELDPTLVPALNQAAYIHAAIFRDSGDVDHGRRVAELCRQSLKLKPDQPNIATLLRAARYFDFEEQEAVVKSKQNE